MNTEYANSWHKPDDRHSGPKMFTTDVRPETYRGYLIYNRVRELSKWGGVWDIVKDGICVGQYAGPSGARRRIDELKSAIALVRAFDRATRRHLAEELKT